MNSALPKSYKTLTRIESSEVSQQQNLPEATEKLVHAICDGNPSSTELIAKEDAMVNNDDAIAKLREDLVRAVPLAPSSVTPVSRMLARACSPFDTSIDRPLRRMSQWPSKVHITFARDRDNPPRRKGSTKPRLSALSIGRTRQARYYLKKPLRLPQPC